MVKRKEERKKEREKEESCLPMNSIDVVRNGGEGLRKRRTFLGDLGNVFLFLRSGGRSWALTKSTIGRIKVF